MKATRILLTALACLAGIKLPAQTWTKTSAPTNQWSSVASSADGSKLVAVAFQDGIYTSTNYGGDWKLRAPGLYGLQWFSVASSADGSMLAAVADSTAIYISTNSGANWATKNVASSGTFTSIASSADGSILAATKIDRSVYVSTNFGASWFSNSVPPSMVNLYGVALSANGSQLVVGNSGGVVMNSTNLGKAWIATNNLTSTAATPSFAFSVDGSKLMAVHGDKKVYVSTNCGISWNTNNVSPASLYSIAISSDGNRVIAVGGILPSGGSYTHISTNSGITWNTNFLSGSGVFQTLASSADGNFLVAASAPGGIWAFQLLPSPQLNLAPSTTSLTLAWTVPSTNFVLQQNFDLTTTNWSVVTNAPVLNLTNLQNQVTLPVPSGNAFFRLKTP